MDPAFTIKLIERAAEESLTAQDVKGLTPLHLAVEYERCVPPRFGILQALLKYGNKALDQQTREPDSYSVYEYHFASRRKYAEKTRRNKKTSNKYGDARLVKAGKKDTTGAQEARSTAKTQRDEKLETKERKPYPSKIEEKTGKKPLVPVQDLSIWYKDKKPRPPGLSVQRAPTMTLEDSSQSPVFKDSSHRRYQANESRQQISSQAEIAANGTNTSKETEYSNRVRSPKSSLSQTSASNVTPSRVPKEKPSDEEANKFAEELKMEYFRSILYHRSEGPKSEVEEFGKSYRSVRTSHPERTYQSAEKFLYRDNRESGCP